MTIIIPKGTGTYADALRAIGTASLLKELNRSAPLISDMGTYFSIECDSKVEFAHWRPPAPGYTYIWLKSKEEKPPGSVLDYEEEKQRAESLKKARIKKKEKINEVLEEQGMAEIETVSREYRLAAVLASMRKGWSSDKELYLWICNNPEKALEWAKSELSGEIYKAPFVVSNSQFFNPASGKGVHAPKTAAKTPGAISNEVVDPFAEWMKYRGARGGMLAYRVGDDFKIFVIEPGSIEVDGLELLKESLVDLNLWGGIRLDIEATLRLAEKLLWHSDVMQAEKLKKIRISGKRPAEVVRGLRQAYFKSLGTASALMNDAFLPLPNWFRIESIEDAEAFIEIIKEHIGTYERGQRKQGCLGSLDEGKSGDVLILQSYRNWLATGTLEDLLDFLGRFIIHIMERKGGREWVKEFSTKNLTVLFERGYGMKEIVDNPGFKSIAKAIRNATITALFLQQQGNKKWDVRFGLAQRWKQKIKAGADEFIPVLSEFVQEYNWEVAQKLEGRGHKVTEQDLDSVISLITSGGKDRSEQVGMLLLAYGYAIDSAPKEK